MRVVRPGREQAPRASAGRHVSDVAADRAADDPRPPDDAAVEPRPHPDAHAAHHIDDAQRGAHGARRADRALADHAGVARARIPLKLDPTPNDINAYAGCDAQGKPFLAGTEGLLQAIFAIAETKACDEIDAARSYDTYMAAVTPNLTSQTPGSPQLQPNVLPAQCMVDPRVLSHARELFDRSPPSRSATSSRTTTSGTRAAPSTTLPSRRASPPSST